MDSPVAALLSGINRYNPDNVQALEEYVALQAKDKIYDCEANLALLKLYQFYPNFFDAGIVAQILLKAIGSLPQTDFALCKYLIDSSKLTEEPLKVYVELGNMLETCDFINFWETLKSHHEVVLNVKGFVEQAQRFICYVVGITYQRCPKSFLMSILNVNSLELPAIIAANNWQEVSTTSPAASGLGGTGGVVNGGVSSSGIGAGDQQQMVFITNHEENIKTKNIKEKIDFASILVISDTFRPVPFGGRN